MTRRLLPATAAAALLALPGCGGGSVAGHAVATRQADASAPIQLATYTCWLWRTAGARERATVLHELRRFYGLPVAGRHRAQGYGTVLSDGQATQLFDGYCRQPYARSFTLYKLYARAAAFAGGAP